MTPWTCKNRCAWATDVGSPYNTSDELTPGTNAPGSGTTPTLIGLGPAEDKLVVIADYGQTVNAVAFWADDIPEDFEQKPSTLSRRIAGQRRCKILSARSTHHSLVPVMAFSASTAQRFLHVHGVIQNLFRVGRHLLRAVHHRMLRARSFSVWDAVTAA